MRAEIEKNIRESLIQRVDQFGDLVDWKVAGSDGSALFKTRDAAVAFIVKATLTPMVRAYYGKPEDMDEMPLAHAGVATPLDQDGTGVDHMGNEVKPKQTGGGFLEPNPNADPDIHNRNIKPGDRTTLWSKHVESMAKRGRVNRAGKSARIQ